MFPPLPAMPLIQSQCLIPNSDFTTCLQVGEREKGEEEREGGGGRSDSDSIALMLTSLPEGRRGRKYSGH